MPLSLYDLFAATARRQPRRPALLGPGPARINYADLLDQVDRRAEQFARAGLRPGGAVGLHAPSGPAYIVCTYAAWRCGACVVPVPTELAAPEKEGLLRTIALPWLVSQPAAAPFAAPFACGPATDLGDGLSLLPLRPAREHPAGFHDLHAAFIRFSSGTTGAAKGVVLSHETIRARIDAANEALRLGPDDRVTWLLSMAYHFAVTIVGYLTFGSAIVLPANALAAAVLDATRRHESTVIYAAPTHYSWLAGAEGAGPLPGLRLALSTTTALDRPTAERFQAKFGLPLTQALGVIEVGLPFINLDFAHDRPEAVGRPLPAYRIRLEDAGLGGGLRDVLLQGPGLFDAYYEPWRPRAEALADGWFRSGDVAEVDGDGCLFLRGRSKDVIDVLGMKFFPQEVESVLAAHPKVEAARVVASARPRVGAVVLAQVVPRKGQDAPSERELLDHCRARLAACKVPQSVEVVAELPRTASGKVLHRLHEDLPAKGDQA